MDLELNGDVVTQNATASDLASCLTSFFNGDEDAFVILALGDDYVQAAKTDDGFVLERHDGATVTLFRCTNEHLSQDQIRAAFNGFLGKSENWASHLSWEEADY